jgi:hypothetical protein
LERWSLQTLSPQFRQLSLRTNMLLKSFLHVEQDFFSEGAGACVVLPLMSKNVRNENPMKQEHTLRAVSFVCVCVRRTREEKERGIGRRRRTLKHFFILFYFILFYFILFYFLHKEEANAESTSPSRILLVAEKRHLRPSCSHASPQIRRHSCGAEKR